MSKRSKDSRSKSRTNTNEQDSAHSSASPGSESSQPRRRIAVFGGDGRPHLYAESQGEVRYFQSRGNGGNGGVKQLEASLRAGGIDLVLVLTKWNGHGATKHIRRLCAQLGVPSQFL